MFSFLNGLPKPQPRLALVYAFSVGLAVGLALIAVVDAGQMADTSQLTGTLGAATTTERIEGEEASGTAAVTAAEEHVAIRLSVNADRPVEAQLSFNAERLRPRAFINKTEGVAIGASIGPGVIEWTAPQDAEVLVEFSRNVGETDELVWTLVRDGEVIATRTLVVR